MFYSQTFLARKGPLSTVWIAAHLQHRLKKSQYTSTDIPSTVRKYPIFIYLFIFYIKGVKFVFLSTSYLGFLSVVEILIL